MTELSLRYAIAVVVFVIVLAIAWIGAKRGWLTSDGIRKHLMQKTWLQFVEVPIVRLIVGRGMPVVIAGACASWIYGISAPFAGWMAERLNPPGFLAKVEPVPDLLDVGLAGLPLVGRERELAALDEFLAGNERFRWWWMVGNDAIARNRLVRGWIERTKSWDAGTLRRGAGADALEVFTLRRPTLIVMEEAGERPEEIRAAIDTLAASSDRLRQVVRVLLVEREKPPSLRSLDDERHARRHRFRRSPLQLGSLDDDALRALIGRARARDRLGRRAYRGAPGDAAPRHRRRRVSRHRRAQTPRRDWYHRMARGGTSARRAVLSAARSPRSAGASSGACPPAPDEATIAGGLPWSDAQAFAPGVRLEVPVCERWLRAGCQRRIPPVTPPILGHFFVLDHLSSLTEIEHRRLMSAAWRTAPDRTSFTLASMHFALAGHSGLALLDRRPDEPELVEPWAEAQLILLLVPDADASARERRLDVLRELASGGEAERTRRLGRALATALARPSALDDLRMLDELEGLATARPNDSVLQAALANGIANSLGAWSSLTASAQLARERSERLGLLFEFDVDIIVDELVSDLSLLAERLPDDVKIQRSFAKGVVNKQLYLLAQEDPKLHEVAACERIVAEVAARHPDDSDLALRVSRSLVDTLRFMPRLPWGEAQARLSRLRIVAEAFPEEPELRSELDLGRAEAVVARARETQWVSVSATLDALGLEEAGRAHALRGAVVSFARRADWTSVNHALSGLADLVVANPDRFEVIDAFRSATGHAVDLAGAEGRWLELDVTLNTARSVADGFPDRPSFRVAIAIGLERATDHLGNVGRVEDVSAHWEELRLLGARWRAAPEIQRLVARGAVNTLWAWSQTLGGAQDEKGWRELEGTWSTVDNLADELMDDREVQRQVLRSAVSVYVTALAANRVPMAESARIRIRRARERFPGDADMSDVLTALRAGGADPLQE